jgi:hypothetical protein
LNNDLDRNHCMANYDEIQAAYEKIWELEQTPQYIETPEALEQLERSSFLVLFQLTLIRFLGGILNTFWMGK